MNPNIVSLQSCIIGNFSVNVHFKNVSDNFDWLLSGVYGPCDTLERRRMWSESSLMRLVWDLPWCVGGDFNEVRLMHERKNCNSSTRGMQDFNKFFDSEELTDSPVVGARFTWRGRNSNCLLSKLDRFMVSESWEAHFPTVCVSALARPFSDHKPIKLSCDLVDRGPTPWRFEDMWLHNTNILELMKEWWNSFSFFGDSGFVLAKKFQALKEMLRTWNRIDRKCDQKLVEIALLDQSEDLNEGLVLSQEAKRNHLKMEYENLADRQEIHYRQKSRIQWQMDGERNTKYYHRIVNNRRRRRNTFASLNINGVMVDDKQAIREEIVSHFENRFKLNSEEFIVLGRSLPSQLRVLKLRLLNTKFWQR